MSSKAEHTRTLIALALMLAAAAMIWSALTAASPAASAPLGPSIVGLVEDSHGVPIAGGEVVLYADGIPTAEATTQADGRFLLRVPDAALHATTLTVAIGRPHFEGAEIALTAAQQARLTQGETVALEPVPLTRRIDAAFWVAALTFAAVLIAIATERLHNTLAALAGMSIVLLVSYLGPLLHESLFIFHFDDALAYIDWGVIFLVMGMMIVIAVVEQTGLFQWLAFQAYRLSGGRLWLLLPILMLVTGVASAFLDNVTTMLLMTPITVEIAIAVGVNPLAFLMPEVMASNVIGVSTLIGTPTNILIGSYSGITFSDFLAYQTPGVLLAFIGLIVYSELTYRKELAAGHRASPALLKQLGKHAQITQPAHLKKAGIIGGGMLLLFIFGEHIHLVPAITALVGATALLLWIRPDMEAMMEAVDWTTLVFFMGLFVLVGAIQEVGVISVIADFIGKLVGENLLLAMGVLTWMSAVLSMIVANIPFTAAMLPVVGYLTLTVPGAESKVLFYCLSVGAAMGGNGTLIGASANLVTAGIAERAGYPISYAYFFKKGFPAVLITVGLSLLWLVIRFMVM